MVDIHSHIINNVDDGSKSLDESIEILKDLISQGVSHVIFTPHYNKYKWDVPKEKADYGFNEIKKAVLERGLNIEVFLGNEIYYKNKDSFIERLEEKKYHTLADSSYFLLELSTMGSVDDGVDACYEIGLERLVPIIAHVERYPYFYEENELYTLKSLMKNGALLQVNCDGILSDKNNISYKFAHFLLENRAVSFVASDVHNMTNRPCMMEDAYDTVSSLYGEDYAYEIFVENPMRVIKNQFIKSPVIESIPKKKKFSGFMSFFRK